MSDRRRLLMAISNTGKWLPYSFEYLYHDLIPTTIDSKQVKNKLKVAKIYGNSVVENQLVQNGNFEDSGNWSGQNGTISTTNNILSYTITAIGGDLASNRIEQTYSTLANHKYLVKVKVKCPYNTTVRTYIGGGFNVLGTATANQWVYLSLIVSTTSTLGNNNLYFDIYNQSSYQVGDVIQVKEYQKIDLTQMFPFDTPTILTDNRVQAILNRGYIPYNTGELKSVDIGEFSSEPYNLFDEELEQGNIASATGQNANGTQYRSKNYVSVVGGLSYTFEYLRSVIPSGSTYFYLYEYDEYYNYLGETISGNSNSSISITPKNETRYVRFKLYNSNDFSGYTPTQSDLKCCLHRTGTRTGYAPHTQPQTISFKYQGSGVGTSQDTMEIGKENVVFTKNMSKVDLSTYTFTHDTTNDIWYSVISTMVNGVWNIKPNILCDKYTTYESKYSDELSSVNKICTIWSTTNRFLIKDTSITQASDISGTLEYQLATPQVITIPRKHLAVVDLGSLSGIVSGGGTNNERYVITLSGIKTYTSSQVANIYCSKYYTMNDDDVYSHTKDHIIGSHNGVVQIYSTDLIGKSADQIKTLLNGTFLWYETQDEVADILDTIGVEAGGTFTSNMFSWVENQLCSGFDVSGWTSNIGTFASVSSSKATITLTSSSGNTYSILVRTGANTNADTNRAQQNHKYLISFKLTSPNANGSSNRIYIGSDSYNAFYSIKSGVNYISAIITYGGSSIANSTITLDLGTGNFSVGDVITIENYEMIDLTLAFGSGNEPTSISDPRIQKILEMGYIPANTTGTYKSVDTKVLPNVDTKIKGK